MKRSCEEVAARKLAMRMMTVAQLRKYLQDREYEAAEINEVIGTFQEDGYLNDEAYCMAYFDHAFAKNKAKPRIFSELRQRGVAGSVMEQAYETYAAEHEQDEHAVARQEMLRILRMEGLTLEDAIPEKLRGRVARRLNSLGYSSGMIYDLLDEMKRGEEQ